MKTEGEGDRWSEGREKIFRGEGNFGRLQEKRNDQASKTKKEYRRERSELP